MDGISVAESAKVKKTKPDIDHFKLSRRMDGGMVVEHVHKDFRHPSISHSFSPDEGPEFHAHLTQHTGLSHEMIGEEDDSRPEPWYEHETRKLK